MKEKVVFIYNKNEYEGDMIAFSNGQALMYVDWPEGMSGYNDYIIIDANDICHKCVEE